MAGQTYQMPEHPEYRTDIRKLQRQDPADAETVFNPLVQAMLENTHFVRLLAAEIIRQNTADHTAIRSEMESQYDELSGSITATAHAALRDNQQLNQTLLAEIERAVGSIPTPDVSGQINTHNSSQTAHAALFGKKADAADLTAHTGSKTNPHGVTAAQAGALPVTGGDLSGNLKLRKNFALIFTGQGVAHSLSTTEFSIRPKYSYMLPDGTGQGTSYAIGLGIPNVILDGTFYGNLHRLQYLGDPVDSTDAATKKYVDDSIEEAKTYADERTAEDVGALPLTGGTVTGKTTFSRGLAVKQAEVNNSLPFFLGIKAFADGGDVQYINAGMVCSCIGAVPVNSDGSVTIGGNLRLQKGNYGTVINLGDGDLVHISEPTDDCLEIKAKRINFVVTDNTDEKFTIQTGVNGTKEAIGKSKQEIVLMSGVPSSLSSKQIALVYV